MDYAYFIGTFKALTEPDFNCVKCKATVKPENRNSKACERIVKKPVMRHFTGMEFFTCPGNFNRVSYAYWFDVANYVENGNMKLDLDMPNKFYEAIEFIGRLRSNYQAEQMKGK